MNSFFIPITLIKNQFQDNLTEMILIHSKNSLREAKIIFVALCIFSLLGLLIYGVWCWQRQDMIVQQSDDLSDPLQKVADQLPVPFIDSPIKKEKKKESDVLSTSTSDIELRDSIEIEEQTDDIFPTLPPSSPTLDYRVPTPPLSPTLDYRVPTPPLSPTLDYRVPTPPLSPTLNDIFPTPPSSPTLDIRTSDSQPIDQIVQEEQKQDVVSLPSPQLIDAHDTHSQVLPSWLLEPIQKTFPDYTVPEVNYAKIFNKLAKDTPVVPTYPYSYENCRFSNILCPVDTLVNVPGNLINVSEDKQPFYLHANLVKLEGAHFILTQYPLPDKIPLFWHVCKEACLIVDLTNANDMVKGLQSYIPEFENFIEYQKKVVVNCTSHTTLKGINAHMHTYHVKENESDNGNFDITRLHYEGWDDFNGISEDDLDRIIAIFEHYQKDPTQPIVIHCRAGVGRSGTVAVAYATHLLMKQNKVDFSNIKVHLRRLILEGRLQRGDGLVQSKEQYEALWKWSCRALFRAQLTTSAID